MTSLWESILSPTPQFFFPHQPYDTTKVSSTNWSTCLLWSPAPSTQIASVPVPPKIATKQQQTSPTRYVMTDKSTWKDYHHLHLSSTTSCLWCGVVFVLLCDCSLVIQQRRRQRWLWWVLFYVSSSGTLFRLLMKCSSWQLEYSNMTWKRFLFSLYLHYCHHRIFLLHHHRDHRHLVVIIIMMLC